MFILTIMNLKEDLKRYLICSCRSWQEI